jgi:hypothetical protein
LAKMRKSRPHSWKGDVTIPTTSTYKEFDLVSGYVTKSPRVTMAEAVLHRAAFDDPGESRTMKEGGGLGRRRAMAISQSHPDERELLSLLPDTSTASGTSVEVRAEGHGAYPTSGHE